MKNLKNATVNEKIAVVTFSLFTIGLVVFNVLTYFNHYN